MKEQMRGFTKIFAFTFRSQVTRKGYKMSAILVALLCFLIPLLAIGGTAYFGQENEVMPETGETAEAEEMEDMEEAFRNLKQVFVVNLSDSSAYSADALKSFDFPSVTGADFSAVSFEDYGRDFEKAREDSRGTDDTLILLTDRQGDQYVLRLLTPEESGLPENTAGNIEPALSAYCSLVSDELNAGLDASGTSDGEESYGEDETGEQPEEENPVDGIKEVLGFVLPYLNIMVLYFFVLIYGQGVAQSVITEKSSRLMEFFLVSVQPVAMIMGKLTAICLCGVMQLTLWILSLAGGFALGRTAAYAIDSDCEMVVLQLLDSFGQMTSGMFSLAGMALCLLLILAGMLLYCSIAGIGGAVASKQEDLSSTNVVFTLILIASFFACLMAGGLDGSGSAAPWLDWIPFTAVMVTPARVLLGTVSLAKGIVCLAVILACAVLFTAAAARIYRMTALYRGNPPGPKKLIRMLRQE